MSLPRLKQLAPDGAAGGDHVEYDASAGLWVPATPALQLVDHVSALADVTSLTLTGLASETDGWYLCVGRISFPLNSAFELRPGGIAQTSIRSSWNQAVDTAPAGATLTSATGWLVGGALSGDASNNGVFHFNAWIAPAENRHGSTSTRAGTRLFSCTGSLDAAIAGEHFQRSFGTWTDNTLSSYTTMLVGGFGSTIERGSEVMLYKLKY